MFRASLRYVSVQSFSRNREGKKENVGRKKERKSSKEEGKKEKVVKKKERKKK
jgi:hypothetical protein